MLSKESDSVLNLQVIRRFVAWTVAACFVCFSNLAFSQTAAPPRLASSAAPVLATPSKPLWNELNALQQQSLKPLATTWETLTDTQKRKWITLAPNFQTMAPAEQTKFHERMTEWAALKPRERELARLNFAETKKVPGTDKAAQWEAYRALTPEERKRLAEKSVPKPHGAAIPVKPVKPNKLTPVPVTRNTPEVTRAQEVSKRRPIDRNTLLPLSNKTGPAATARPSALPVPAPSVSEPVPK
jgi:hypothetical protein